MTNQSITSGSLEKLTQVRAKNIAKKRQ